MYFRFSVKEGSRIELKAYTRLARAKCLEHITDAAISLGWPLDKSLSSESRIVAAAPPDPVFDQLVSVLMFRSARPTHFDLSVSSQEGRLSLTLVVFVTQPRPGKPVRFQETLHMVGKAVSHEFAKSNETLRWKRSDFASFQRAMEDAAQQGLSGDELRKVAEDHAGTEWIF